MADETNVESTEPEAKETDWKAKYESMRAHSREWERKAKDNQRAADELQRLQAENLTDAQRLEQRAAKAEEELAVVKAEMQRTSDAREVAEMSGVPLVLLMHCRDREDMEAFVKEYAAETKVPAASPAPSHRIVRGDGAKVSTRDAFADLMEQAFSH